MIDAPGCPLLLLWEQEFNARGVVVDRLESAVDGSLSVELVVLRADRKGQPFWPWMAYLLP